MSKAENELKAAQVYTAATSIAAEIKNAPSQDIARQLLSRLESLLSNPAIRHSSRILSLIADLISQGSADINTVASLEQATQAQDEAQRQALTQSNQRLTDSFDRQNIWLEGDKEYYESLQKKETIIQLDETGSIVHDAKGNPKMVEINGERLKESMAIYKAFANEEKLDQQGREELNKKLYGDKRGPQNEKQRQEGIKRLQEANRDVEGLAARDGDQANAEIRSQAIQEKIEAYSKRETTKEELIEQMKKHDQEQHNDRVKNGTQPGVKANKEISPSQHENSPKETNTDSPNISAERSPPSPKTSLEDELKSIGNFINNAVAEISMNNTTTPQASEARYHVINMSTPQSFPPPLNNKPQNSPAPEQRAQATR